MRVSNDKRCNYLVNNQYSDIGLMDLLYFVFCQNKEDINI